MTFDCITKDFFNSMKFGNNEFYTFDSRFAEKKHQSCNLGKTFAPMYPYLNDMAIVNGIMMNYNNSVHEINRAYMTSGNQDSNTPFATFAMAQNLSKGKKFRVGYRMEYEPLLDGGYSQKVATSTLNSYNQSQNPNDIYKELLIADTQINSFQKDILMENLSEQLSITTMANFISSLNMETNPTTEGYKQAALATAGLGSGFLTFAQVDFVNDGELDTHSGHINRQTTSQGNAFSMLAKLITWMKKTPYKNDPKLKKSVFDVTTILVTSEFTRTSWMEGGDGTSHNQYNNSCLLLGKNVNGGTVLGKSEIYKSNEVNNNSGRSMYHAAPFDFKKQVALSKQEYAKIDLEKFGVCNAQNPDCSNYIFPETIWRTIANNFGAQDVTSLGKGPILKNLFKNS